MNVFRLALTAVFLASGTCFVMTCLFSDKQGVAMANALVFGASMISLAILSRREAGSTQ